MQAVIREKDRESTTFLGVIETLKRQNSKLRSEKVAKPRVRALDSMMEKLAVAERQNYELKKEIMALKRIQNE